MAQAVMPGVERILCLDDAAGGAVWNTIQLLVRNFFSLGTLGHAAESRADGFTL